MSIEYNYDDSEHRWPCLGPMTVDELNAEWLRCYRLKQTGDLVIKPWCDHRLSDRVRGIEEELLSREFIFENHARFLRREISPNGAEFERWCYAKFMSKDKS